MSQLWTGVTPQGGTQKHVTPNGKRWGRLLSFLGGGVLNR